MRTLAKEIGRWPLRTMTSLPSDPYDGQDVFYLADAANGVVWHLRYRADATGPFKWESVGQATPLWAENTAGGNYNGTSYGDSTVGGQVSLVVPLAGDYLIAHGAAISSNNGSGTWETFRQSFAIGGIAAIDLDAAATSNTSVQFERTYVSIMRERRKTAIAAGATLQLKGKVSVVGSNYGADNRWLRAIPLRVG